MTGLNTEAAHIQSDDQGAVIRANISHALARAYDRPDSWPADISAILEDAFAPCGGTMRELAQAMAKDIAGGMNDLSIVHARLFVGPFAVEAAPWASFYLDPEKQLMGPISLYAAEAFAEAGLGPVNGAGDAPDHITRELEFMYFLAFQEATTGAQEWLERQQRFWREHLGQWLPQLADALASTATDSLFYLHLSKLTREYCAWQGHRLAEDRPS